MQDRRQHDRFDLTRAIYIEVVRRGSVRDRHSDVMRCETVDVSISGIKAHVPHFVETGSTLNVAAYSGDWAENLELVGEAMWCTRVDEGDGYWLGLALKDTTEENMHRWFQVIYRQQEAREAG